jgi:hypothetical protein
MHKYHAVNTCLRHEWGEGVLDGRGGGGWVSGTRPPLPTQKNQKAHDGFANSSLTGHQATQCPRTHRPPDHVPILRRQAPNRGKVVHELKVAFGLVTAPLLRWGGGGGEGPGWGMGDNEPFSSHKADKLQSRYTVPSTATGPAATTRQHSLHNH